jgi:accessory gene regulator B
MFLVCGLIAKYMPSNITKPLVFVSMFTAIFIVQIFAPKDNPNKPITEEWEINKFNKQSVILTFLLFATSMLLLKFNFHIYASAICFGVVLEIFSITPAGFRFFDWVAGKKTSSRSGSS